MIAGSSSGSGPEPPDLDFLDGLRLEYVVSVIRFFTGAPDIWVTGGFVENRDYSRIILMLDNRSEEELEEAFDQLTDSFDRVIREENGERVSLYRFSIGSKGLETNFTVACSEELDRKVGEDCYRV